MTLPAVKTEQSRRFVLYSNLEASSSKSWLVDRIFGAGEFSAAYGPPGCGKGVIVQDMALHVAAGLEWHGRPVTRGAVLYIALERRKLVERRAIAFRIKHELYDLPFAIAGGIYDFRNPATAAQIAELCKEVKSETGETIVLVIVDTISRALAGGDENSPKDMGALVATVARLQETTSAHVLFLHHIPHDGERMRGHGALLGAVDTTIAVVNTGGVRTAKVVKANDSEEGEGISFTIDGVEVSPDGTTAAVAVPAAAQPPKASEPKLPANQKTLLAMLHTAGSSGLTLEDWNNQAREAGIGVKRKADLNDIRAALLSKQLVRQYGDRWTVNHN